MAIQYVGGKNALVEAGDTPNVVISLTDLAGGLATLPSTGDIVLVAYSIGSSTDIAMAAKMVTSGYTQVAELYANDTYDANLSVWYKIMGATPDTDVTVARTGNLANSGACVVKVYRGVSLTTPLDTTVTTTIGVNGGSVNPPPITPATSDNILVFFGTSGLRSFSPNYTTTSYMANFEVRKSTTGASYYTFLGGGDVSGASAGVSYDGASWTLVSNSTSNSWTAVSIALRSAVTQNTITAVGAVVAQSATAIGAGVRTAKFVGAVTSQVVSTTASGLRTALSSAAVSVQKATIASTTYLTRFASAAVTSSAAIISATGVKTLQAFGAVTASIAIAQGIGITPLKAVGAVFAKAATVTSAGLRTIILSATVSSQKSFVSGLAELILTAAGAVSAKVASASGSGFITTLAMLIYPKLRTEIVLSENRSLPVEQPLNTTLVVESENRTEYVEQALATLAFVEAENRTLIVR